MSRLPWMGNVLCGWSLISINVLSRKSPAHNEVLFVSSHWRLYIRLDRRCRGCCINHGNTFWSLYKSWNSISTSEFGVINSQRKHRSVQFNYTGIHLLKWWWRICMFLKCQGYMRKNMQLIGNFLPY